MSRLPVPCNISSVDNVEKDVLETADMLLQAEGVFGASSRSVREASAQFVIEKDARKCARKGVDLFYGHQDPVLRVTYYLADAFDIKGHDRQSGGQSRQ